MRWESLREEEFEEAIARSKGLCVIPLACLEKHGQHLPVGTDYYEANEIALNAAQEEYAVVFPTGPWLGDVAGYHARIEPQKNHGGIGLDPMLVIRTLEALADEIARNGFTKILIFNEHGGNLPLLKILLRRHEQQKKPYALLCTDADDFEGCEPGPFLKTITENRAEFPMITDEDIQVMRRWAVTGYHGGHADFIETANVFATHPEQVAPDRYDAEDGMNNHCTDYLSDLGVDLNGSWSARYPNMYAGMAPHGCSEGIGLAMMKLHVRRAARIFRKIKNEDICLDCLQARDKAETV